MTHPKFNYHSKQFYLEIRLGFFFKYRVNYKDSRIFVFGSFLKICHIYKDGFSWFKRRSWEFKAPKQDTWTAANEVLWMLQMLCGLSGFLCFYMRETAVLTGIVWLPWSALIADWASVCVENLTKAQPGRKSRCTPHTGKHTQTYKEVHLHMYILI